MVGRNGLFYDRKGRDWDATITKVVENPISIRQAFWSPYKKLVRLIEEQVAKRAAAADAEADKRRWRPPPAAAAAAAAPAPPAPAKKIDVGTVAAIGVAIGGIGALVATLIGYLAGLFKLPFWQLVLVIAGILLLISAPVDAHRLAQAAAAQPRPDPRRQRLGRERPRQAQRASSARRSPRSPQLPPRALCRPAPTPSASGPARGRS